MTDMDTITTLLCIIGAAALSVAGAVALFAATRRGSIEITIDLRQEEPGKDD